MVEASIRLRRKVLPGRTTVAAWFKRERRSLFVPVRRGVVVWQVQHPVVEEAGEVPQFLLG